MTPTRAAGAVIAVVVLLASATSAVGASGSARSFTGRLLQPTDFSSLEISGPTSVRVGGASTSIVQSATQRLTVQAAAGRPNVTLRDSIVRFMTAHAGYRAGVRAMHAARARSGGSARSVTFKAGHVGVRSITCATTCTVTVVWSNVGVLASVSARGLARATAGRWSNLVVQLARLQDRRIIGVPVPVPLPLGSGVTPVDGA